MGVRRAEEPKPEVGIVVEEEALTFPEVPEASEEAVEEVVELLEEEEPEVAWEAGMVDRTTGRTVRRPDRYRRFMKV